MGRAHQDLMIIVNSNRPYPLKILNTQVTPNVMTQALDKVPLNE